MKDFDVIIVGGGASGLLCSIDLAKKGFNVALIEQSDRVGKKLLATGNGKCNLTNENISSEYYNEPSFVQPIIEKYNAREVVEYFNSLGLCVRCENSLFYPYSERANTVLNVLLYNMEKYNVKIFTSQRVKIVKEAKDGTIKVTTENDIFNSKVVVMATGSSTNNVKVDYSIVDLETTNLQPGITFIKTSPLRGLNGIRAKAKLTLYRDNKIITSETGELLFKDVGLSGIVSFKLSSFIARDNLKGINNHIVLIDFMPDHSREKVVEILKNSSLKEPLEGILATPLVSFVKGDTLKETVENLKGKKLKVLGLGDNAQVMVGGYDLKQFNYLSSIKYPNVFVIGEALNIDGECGGYNLHWAFASALYASSEIARKLK